MQLTKQQQNVINRSLISTAAMILLGAISHAYFLGHSAFIAGIILLLLSGGLNRIYKSSANKFVLFFYLLINTLAIIGFGIIDGFWNHALKVALTYLHGGHLPPVFTGIFQNPEVSTFLPESIGILTFIASMFAAYYGFKIIQKKQNSMT